jgi:signal transduction histidine kinase
LRRLHDIFLRKFLLLFLSIFITLGLIFYIWIKNIYIEQTKIDLLNNISIVSLQINNLNNLGELTKKIQETINLRITIIASDGKVIAESDEDINTMDNHLNRIEIIQSKYEEKGSVVRYSSTVKKKLLYVSKKFTVNEHEYYIRMARDVENINEQFLYLSFKIGLLFLAFLLVAFLISLKISKEVQDETKLILEFLRNLSNQKKEIKIKSNYSIEFDKITKLLTNVSLNLSKKDNQKLKYTQKLKDSNSQKDDIIAAISHEFKNPIAVISGYTQTLLEDNEINKNIQKKFLNKIFNNSLKITNMIDRLRLSIKLEQGTQSYSIKKTNITKLTLEIIDDLKLTYLNREIRLHAKDIIIKVDETMFNIAITNLIENALKYSQDSVDIKIDEDKISIIDSGVGIKDHEITKITNKFYRVKNNGWNNSLGVGLSLVKNIVTQHKFKLQIKSNKNEGSNFSIIFTE